MDRLVELLMHCVVYKSNLKVDTYIYVTSEDALEQIPSPLREALGRLSKVMDLQLNAERKLARVDVIEVIRALQSRGYFLQMPPVD